VRALVGGRNFDDSKFNRATQALRQPGSTFKPIVYADAIRNGRPPSYLLDDSPLAVPQLDGETWTPQNYDLKFEGQMPMREALYKSRNLAAIRIGMELGEPSVIEMARRFGITTEIQPYPAIHIGSASVYPMELVAAFSAFANLGVRASPNAILRVENNRGEILWSPTPVRSPVLSPEEAWIVVDMMKDVVRRGTAFSSVYSRGFRIPSAGKTGTTNDGNDVWYIGYTADLVAGVWLGLDKPQKIKDNAQGGVLAAPAWTAFMMEVYQRKPAPPDWPRPEVIISRNIDRTTGLLENPFCPREVVYREFFLPGTEPIRECDIHNPFSLLPTDTLGILTTPPDPGAGVRVIPGGAAMPTPARVPPDSNPFRVTPPPAQTPPAGGQPPPPVIPPPLPPPATPPPAAGGGGTPPPPPAIPPPTVRR
jgi:penicillin-binding protein 1A